MWHIEQSKLNSGVFEDPGDFVELERSPSKFDNPSNHECIDDFLLDNNATEPLDLKTVQEEADENEMVKGSATEEKPKKRGTSISRKSTSNNFSSRSGTRRAFLKNQTKALTIKLRDMSPIKASEGDSTDLVNASEASASVKKKLIISTAKRSQGEKSVPKQPS